jgi:hypothetical protein
MLAKIQDDTYTYTNGKDPAEQEKFALSKLQDSRTYKTRLFTNYFDNYVLNLPVSDIYPIYEIPIKKELSGGKRKNNIGKNGKNGNNGKNGKTEKNIVRKETLLGSVRSIYKVVGEGNKLFVDIKGIQKLYTEIKKQVVKK